MSGRGIERHQTQNLLYTNKKRQLTANRQMKSLILYFPFQKTLNPVFDECFEFSVTQEQCQAEVAMIVFTVMDHDVLTANDFAGEAFLALNNIPGVGRAFNMNIDNFDCVAQMDLPLLEMKDKSMGFVIYPEICKTIDFFYVLRSPDFADLGRTS